METHPSASGKALKAKPVPDRLRNVNQVKEPIG